jgi:CcmD family protein
MKATDPATDRATPTQGDSPNDRATSFQAVQGNPTEQYNGATLLVSAYAILWVIVFVWIALVWRKQSSLGRRLDDLERVLDQAAAVRDKKG